MAIASFQGKVFQVSSRQVYTLANLTMSGAIDAEAQEKNGSKPSTYIKGLGLELMSFQIPLSSAFGHNVRTEIESWQSIRDKRKPDVIILGSKPVGKNKWLLKSVSVSNMELDGSGNLVKATLAIELEEYVRAGQKTEDSTSAAALDQTLIPNISDVIPPVSSSSGTSYEEFKRENPNSKMSVTQFSGYSLGPRG